MSRALFTRVLGVFTILLSTYLAWGLEGRPGYLIILAASAIATIFIVTGLKPILLGLNFDVHSPPIPLLLAIGGVILGLEGVMLLALYNEATSAYYALATLAGSFIVLWGNYATIRIKMPVLKER